jgi:hypothetical protein
MEIADLRTIMNKISPQEFEQMVCQYTNGRKIGPPGDVLSRNQSLLEAKVSNAQPTGSVYGPRRWRCHWTRLRGTNGQQRYDRLILGANFYTELVLFDIPFDWILYFTRNNPWRDLNCSEFYGPYSTAGLSGFLYHTFKSTPAQLLARG